MRLPTWTLHRIHRRSAGQTLDDGFHRVSQLAPSRNRWTNHAPVLPSKPPRLGRHHAWRGRRVVNRPSRNLPATMPEKTPRRKHSVQARAGMAFAQYESVAFGPVELGGIYSEDIVVEHHEQINHRESRSSVRTLGAMDHPKRLRANSLRQRSNTIAVTVCLAHRLS